MFIAQTTLETWVDAGGVDVGKDTVHLTKVGRTYHLEPAVRFLTSLEGAAKELIGKVLTEKRVGELGGGVARRLCPIWGFSLSSGVGLHRHPGSATGGLTFGASFSEGVRRLLRAGCDVGDCAAGVA